MSANPTDDNGPPQAGGRCPVCGKPAAARNRPFCSARCADVDLQGWLSGRYAIPIEDERDPDDLSAKDGRDP